MHDIWNPWHGCTKCSPGCQNCYMYYLDKKYGSIKDSSIITKTLNFDYPLKKNRKKKYKIQSGELIRVNMASDTFITEADEWRDEMWKIIKKRSDVIFFILTKRAERIECHLPLDWGNGYENVSLNVTCENQEKANERIPILKSIPAKHKGIMIAPMLMAINIEQYLQEGFIEQVILGGENYDKPRECHYEWVKSISEQCEQSHTNFAFIETGTNFWKDGKQYWIPNKSLQSKQAYKSCLSKHYYDIEFKLIDQEGNIIPKNKLYKPMYNAKKCKECGGRMTCNGCSNCGKCGKVILVTKEEIEKL